MQEDISLCSLLNHQGDFCIVCLVGHVGYLEQVNMALVLFFNVPICLRIYPTSCSGNIIFTLAPSESDEVVAKLSILKGHTTNMGFVDKVFTSRRNPFEAFDTSPYVIR